MIVQPLQRCCGNTELESAVRARMNVQNVQSRVTLIQNEITIVEVKRRVKPHCRVS